MFLITLFPMNIATKIACFWTSSVHCNSLVFQWVGWWNLYFSCWHPHVSCWHHPIKIDSQINIRMLVESKFGWINPLFSAEKNTLFLHGISYPTYWISISTASPSTLGPRICWALARGASPGVPRCPARCPAGNGRWLREIYLWYIYHGWKKIKLPIFK